MGIRQQRQGGWVVGFVVVGVLLTLGLLGGLYYVKTRAGSIEKASTKVAQKTEEKANKTSDAAKKATDDAKKAAENKAAPAPAPAPTPVDTNTKPADAPATSSAPASNPSASAPVATAPVTATGGSSNLPQTGPAEDAASVMVIGVLAFAATSYVYSRRAAA